MEDLQNEANPFIIISQTKIWTKPVQNIFNHMLELISPHNILSAIGTPHTMVHCREAVNLGQTCS